VPGSIPQGIYFLLGKPFYEMSLQPHYETGETWDINTNFIQAISLLPRDRAQYPLEVPEHVALAAMFVLGCALLCTRRASRAWASGSDERAD